MQILTTSLNISKYMWEPYVDHIMNTDNISDILQCEILQREMIHKMCYHDNKCSVIILGGSYDKHLIKGS